MSGVIGFLIVLFLLYAFCGAFAFLPRLFGYLWGIVFFPVEIINQVIYPVGDVVYLVYSGLFCYIIVLYIVNLFKNHF